MLKPFRVLDTGVLEGRLNIAIGQAIVEARQQDTVPDTLRFLRFPPTALVGRHQALGQEIDLQYCRNNAIGIARRITGGGAIFMEPGLLGWELAFHRKTLGVRSLPDLTREICEAAAEGISRLGVNARFRPRNDIEVDGRKISGTGDGSGARLRQIERCLPLPVLAGDHSDPAKLCARDRQQSGIWTVSLQECSRGSW